MKRVQTRSSGWVNGRHDKMLNTTGRVHLLLILKRTILEFNELHRQ